MTSPDSERSMDPDKHAPDKLAPDKLAKVLAMAESAHEGEALSALRAARIMLSRAGLSLRDLAHSGPARSLQAPPAQSAPADPIMGNVALRRQVCDLERELTGLKRQLEQASEEVDRQRKETQRWRRLARETAYRLWDLGKALEGPQGPQVGADRRRALLDRLREADSSPIPLAGH